MLTSLYKAICATGVASILILSGCGYVADQSGTVSTLASSPSVSSELQTLDITNDPELSDYDPSMHLSGLQAQCRNIKWLNHKLAKLEKITVRYDSVDDELTHVYVMLQKNLFDILLKKNAEKTMRLDIAALREAIRIARQELDLKMDMLKNPKKLKGQDIAMFGLVAAHDRIMKEVIMDANDHDAADTMILGLFNTAPVAAAGDDLTVIAGSTVMLKGSGTDANGDSLTYQWTAGSGIVLSNANIANPTFVAPMVAGTYTLTLIVNDGFVNSVADSMTVTVVVPNVAPIAAAGSDMTVIAGSTVVLNGSGTDANGDALSFHWTASNGIVLSDANIANPSFTAPLTGGSYIMTLVVSDGMDKSLASSMMVTVIVPNHAPVADAGMDMTVAAGTVVTLHGTGTDEDGNSLSFHWTAAAGITLSDPSAMNPSFTALTPGTYVFSLMVSDGKAVSVADEVTITVLSSNHAPIVDAGEDTSVTGGRRVYLHGSAYDPDGDPLTVRWTSDNGIVINSPEEFETFITSPSSGGAYRFVLTVSDGKDTASDFVMVLVEE